MYQQVMHFPQINILPLQLYVNNAAYVYNEETGEIEMLSQVDSVDDLQVRHPVEVCQRYFIGMIGQNFARDFCLQGGSIIILDSGAMCPQMML